MKKTGYIAIAAVAATLSLSLLACSGAPTSPSASTGSASGASASIASASGGSASGASASAASSNTDDNTTDQMFDRHESQAEINVVVKDGRVKTVEYGYDLDYFPGIEDLHEGASYKLIADVTYLNGGVAGYVDFPKIEEVYSIEEVPAS